MNTRANILIVDDDPEMRDYIARSLRGRPRVGELLQAEDGERAWAVVRDGRVQVLLADMNLPHLDGLALCERLDADASLRTIPILLVTGDASHRPGALQFVSRVPRRAVLFKPFNATDLRTAVDRLLDALFGPEDASAAAAAGEDLR